MERTEILPILGVMSAVIITIISGVVTDLEILKVSPDYTIKIISENDASPKLNYITITNDGLVQAKNAVVYVVSNSTIKGENNECFEGNILQYNTNILKVDFPQMSTGITCKIVFYDLINSTINQVTVVADNSPGNEFYPSAMKTITDDELIVTYSDPNAVLKKLVPIILILYIVMTVFYFFLFNKKKRRRSSILKKLQKEHENNLKHAQKELDRLNQIRMTKKSFSANLLNRITSLEREILYDKSHIDEISVKLINHRTQDKDIGKYFDSWRMMEKYLHKKILSANINLHGNVDLTSITQHLFNEHEIEKTPYEKLISQIEFRVQSIYYNRVSNSEIMEKIKELSGIPLNEKK